MNRITLYGRLTRKPETLSGSNGKPVCRFSISVRRQYRREGEEYRYDFFDCVAFGKLGELIGSRFGHKDYILISGPVQDNNYERDGQMVYRKQVIVEDMTFVGDRRPAEKQEEGDNFMEIPDGIEEELPFASPYGGYPEEVV